MTTSAEPPPASLPLQPPPRRPKRVRNIILIVLAAVVGLIIIFVLAIFLLVNESTEEPLKVSDQLVVAVQQGDGAAAYALTGPSFRAATTEPQLSELVENLSTLVSKEKVSAKQKSINVSSGNGKIAVFVYTMDGTDGGGSIYFKTQIREEAGRWQVMNFRSSRTQLGTDVE